MLNTYEDFTLQQLKNKGHALLDEYISLDMRTRSSYNKRQDAYAALAKIMKVETYLAHFSSMTTKKDVDHAITCITQMLVNMRLANEEKVRYACAPRDVVQKELAIVATLNTPTYSIIETTMKTKKNKKESSPIIAQRNADIIKDYLANMPTEEICKKYFVEAHTVYGVTKNARDEQKKAAEVKPVVVEKHDTEYTIVKAITITNLITIVNTSIKTGYRVTGGVFQFSEKDVVYSGQINYYFAQALVK